MNLVYRIIIRIFLAATVMFLLHLMVDIKNVDGVHTDEVILPTNDSVNVTTFAPYDVNNGEY